MGDKILQRVRKYVRKKPVVVAALQSPHLLNIWEQGKHWRLYCDLLGDHEGLEESKDLQVPFFEEANIDIEKVSVVLVTSPLQLETARDKFPRSRVYWVVHTGYFPGVLPTEHADKIDGIITLTRRVQDSQYVDKPVLKKKNNFVIPPFYQVKNVWSWEQGVLWTIRSRASSRMAPTKDRFEAVVKGVGQFVKRHKDITFLFYGQEAPQGYINQKGKERLYSSSSAYISALPVDAGFGLAEHEAMAHGVPIVGSRWGDIDVEMAQEYPSLVETEEEMIEAAKDLAVNRKSAELASRLGLLYIRRYRNKKAMNRQIKEFAFHVQENPTILL